MHEHLRAWRKLKGLSQEHVANILGVKHTTIGRWERGVMRLSTEDLQRLAHVYGITVAELSQAPEAADLVSRLAQVQDVVEGMSPADFEHWIALGRALKK